MKTSLAIVTLVIFLIPSPVIAHSGRTDSYGGHNCYVGACAGTYHYHGGYTPPRQVTPKPSVATPKPTIKPSVKPTIKATPKVTPTPLASPSVLPTPSIVPTIQNTPLESKNRNFLEWLFNLFF